MKKTLIFPVIALTLLGCESLMNQATCYYFLKPGVTQDVCEVILPVFKQNGLTTPEQIKGYTNFVKNELPANKWKYGIQFATNSAVGETKTYLNTTKDAVVALADLATKQKDPIKFTSDVYSNALQMGKLFK